MNQMIQPTTKNFQTATELRSCGVCDFQDEMEVGTRLCPKCNEPNLLTANSVAWHGRIMAFLGAVLMFMGFALILITSENFSNARTIKSKFRLPENPPPAFAESILYFIFGGLFCLGLSFLTAGAVQAFYQRRNLTLLRWSIGLTNFFFLFAYVLMFLFSE